MERILQPIMHNARTDPILRRERTALRNELQHAENHTVSNELYLRRVRELAADLDELPGDSGRGRQAMHFLGR